MILQLALKQSETDEAHLLNHRKLVLLVDLDQTIIHSTDQPSGSIEGLEVRVRIAHI
jgi:TFIIF-interacting CTD phosphatase-like protein